MFVCTKVEHFLVLHSLESMVHLFLILLYYCWGKPDEMRGGGGDLVLAGWATWHECGLYLLFRAALSTNV